MIVPVCIAQHILQTVVTVAAELAGGIHFMVAVHGENPDADFPVGLFPIEQHGIGSQRQQE